MSKFKKFILLNIILFLTACGTIKEGFTNKKKNSSDEFLVEKKFPLVMPPDYNQLPIPKTYENGIDLKKPVIETLIAGQENESDDSDTSEDDNNNLEESVLDKIKNN